MNQKRIRKIVFSAMFCALVFAATWFSIPAPTIGNINLGDGVLLLCAWMLGGPWAAVSAALGATLTDLMGAYAIYAPGTFVIKALMVVVAILVCKLGSRLHISPRISRILSAISAEIVMILGYFLYESAFLGYGIGAAANMPFNAIQGTFGILVACIIYEILSHTGISLGNDSHS